MFKKFLFLSAALAIASSSYANTFPPVEVQKLIEKAESLNDKCRGGSGDNPGTLKSCDSRDLLIEKIEKKGYCYGSFNAKSSHSEYRWLPCKKDATRK